MDEDFTKFSDNFAKSLTDVYRVGGFALVLIFVGIIAI